MTCERSITLLSRAIDIESGRSRTLEVIGRVTFLTHHGEEAEAILDRSGRWQCPKLPVLDRVLNGLFTPRGVAGDIGYGHAELRRVGYWFGRRLIAIHR